MKLRLKLTLLNLIKRSLILLMFVFVFFAIVTPVAKAIDTTTDGIDTSEFRSTAYYQKLDKWK